MIYCVVPPTLGSGTVRPLRRAFRDSQDLTIVVDRRARERRAEVGRRTGLVALQGAPDRRVVAHAAGRRIADRRAMVVPVAAPALPWRARRAALEIAFLTHVQAPQEWTEDAVAARLAIAVQLGERSALRELYLSHFDCVFAFARTSLRSAKLGEEAAQQTFLRAHERIGDFDPATQTFRAWLFAILCEGLDPLGSAPPPLQLAEEPLDSGLDALAWLDDEDLRVLLDRVPRPHRDVLLLRYMLGLPSVHAAQLLECTVEEERELHDTGLRELEHVIAQIGRVPRSLRRENMRRLPTAGLVIRRRQMALRG